MVCLLQGLKVKIYRLRRPEVLSLVPLIPLQKLPVRFSPGGLEKIPHILGSFLDILLPFLLYENAKDVAATLIESGCSSEYADVKRTKERTN